MRALPFLHAAALLAAGPIAQSPPATATIEGRVVDLRGEPVPAAAIAISTWQEPDAVVARGTSDGEGWFRMTRIPSAEGWNVRASAPGLVSSGEQASPRSPRVRVLMMDTAVVSGALTNRAGEPVPHAIVRAELMARCANRAFADATTDDAGRFAVQAPLGFLQIAAVVPGEGLAAVNQRIGGTATIALSPTDGPQTPLRVQIRGLAADVMPDIRLSVRPYGPRRHTPFPPPWHQPRLDAEGVFAIEHAPAWKYVIYPSSSAHSFAPRQFEVAPGSGPQDLVFTATAIDRTTLPFAARALDADGRPVAGVTFELRAPNGGTRVRATSDEDGNVVFASPLALGEPAVVYSVDRAFVTDQLASAHDFAMSNDDTRQMHHCAIGKEPVQLRMIPACTVTGSLTRASGGPASGVELALEYRSTGWPAWRGFDYTTTARDGSYAFHGLHPVAAPVRISVSGPDGSAVGQEFAVAEAGAQVVAPPLVLSPPAIVEGVVRGADRSPAPGVHVWLRDWDLARNQQQSGSVVETITDHLGRYRFVGVPEGGAWLQVLVDDENPRGRAVEPFAVEPGKTHTFDLQLPAK